MGEIEIFVQMLLASVDVSSGYKVLVHLSAFWILIFWGSARELTLPEANMAMYKKSCKGRLIFQFQPDFHLLPVRDSETSIARSSMVASLAFVTSNSICSFSFHACLFRCGEDQAWSSSSCSVLDVSVSVLCQTCANNGFCPCAGCPMFSFEHL